MLLCLDTTPKRYICESCLYILWVSVHFHWHLEKISQEYTYYMDYVMSYTRVFSLLLFMAYNSFYICNIFQDEKSSLAMLKQKMWLLKLNTIHTYELETQSLYWTIKSSESLRSGSSKSKYKGNHHQQNPRKKMYIYWKTSESKAAYIDTTYPLHLLARNKLEWRSVCGAFSHITIKNNYAAV